MIIPNDKYPSMEEAFELFNESFMSYEKRRPDSHYDEHCTSVAACAEIIASSTKDLNPQKSYILGLLHDYGKIIDEKEAFHGNTGHNLMIKKGYNPVAKICITHSFPNKEFKIKDYNYDKDELKKSKALLDNMEYDDYDRLIQLSDLLVINLAFVPIKERIINIQTNYDVAPSIAKKKYKEAMHLKKYFDNKCGIDIYKLLGLS